jgi:hypothetical protein
MKTEEPLQPELFAVPPQPPRRLTRLEKRAAYHAIKFYLFRDPEDHLNGKLLTAVKSAMDKLKPRRKTK